MSETWKALVVEIVAARDAGRIAPWESWDTRGRMSELQARVQVLEASRGDEQ
jgi:hypothetical protein